MKGEFDIRNILDNSGYGVLGEYSRNFHNKNTLLPMRIRGSILFRQQPESSLQLRVIAILLHFFNHRTLESTGCFAVNFPRHL